MWTDLIQAIGASKDALAAIFAAVAIIVSILGLRAWRKQITGKTEYEVARRLLLTVLKARDAVSALRAPFISGDEMAEAAKGKYEITGDDEEKPDSEKLTELAYGRRWERVRESLSALAVEQLEAQVLLKRGVEERLQAFQDCILELHAALEQYLEMRRGEYTPPQEDEERIKRVVLRNWGAAKSLRKDVFGERFEATIRDLEGVLKPFLDLR